MGFRDFLSDYFDVSIPRWFDSSKQARLGRAAARTVSIPRWFDSSSNTTAQPYGPMACFNSTMVRFKRRASPYSHRANEVSIPRWFDSSRAFRCRIARQVYGFNSTMVRFKLLQLGAPFPRLIIVSIPRWFDSSPMHDIGDCSARTGVSIPRWFDSSDLGGDPEDQVVGCFNSTMVRFKRVALASGD